MHKLLERQLKKVTRRDGSIDMGLLLTLVDQAYEDGERDHRRTNHAMEEMQREVEDLYQRTRLEAESRFTVVMNNMGEAVVITDDKGMVTSLNSSAERIFGYTLAEVWGRAVTMLLPEEDLTAEESPWTLAEAGTACPIGNGREVTARRKTGEEFPVDLVIGEAQDEARRQFICVVRDISQRKQAEQALKESEAKFRELVGSASDWFWETDAKHCLTFVSERISLVLGVKASEIVGLTFLELGMSDTPHVAAEHTEDIDAQRPFRDRVFHVGPEEGKDSRSLRISGVPIHAEDGTFMGYRGVGIDVTREAAAERRARLAQQRLADAIESLDDGIAVYDPEDRLVICNKVYRHVFSASDDNIAAGTTFVEVLEANRGHFSIPDMSFDQWLALRIDHHRRAQGDAMIVRMTDGSWFLSRDFRMADGGVVSVRTDVTELKRKQQEIEFLKSRYELILDSAGEGIVGLDGQGRVTFANRQAATALGWESGGLILADFHALVQDQELEGTYSQIALTYRDGIGSRVSGDLFRRADGSQLPVDYYVAPMTERDGKVSGAVVVFRDATLRLQYERTLANSHRELERLVTERTKALSREVEVRARTEGALRESRERLKGITNALFEGVLVVNRSGDLVFANPSAQRLLHIDPNQDIEGLPLDELFTVGAEHLPFEQSPWRGVIDNGDTVREDDAVFVMPDGTKLPVAYACSATDGDSHRAAIISFRDIAALKDAQREALQSSRMASVGQLAAGIAHEINTPTQYIGDNLRFVGESFADLKEVFQVTDDLYRQAQAAGLSAAATYAEAVERTDLSYLCEEIPTAVTQSLEGVAQVGRIVLSMKEFSHPGSSSKTTTDINHALDNTLTVCRNTWKHVAEVETHFDPELPSVLCHAGEMNQVFLNLIVNAAHAIEESGKPGIGLIVLSTCREEDQVVIRITDSGNGVPESLRERIFDPFFTTKQVGKGTGQGLAICRDVVVTKHGGRLDVGGEAGQGAEFTVRLPLGSESDPINATEDALT